MCGRAASGTESVGPEGPPTRAGSPAAGPSH
ncbi:DUF6053 domain-containing protein [Lysobacter enzymogenes]